MGIAFSRERFKEINKTYNAWWNHTLDRPVLGAAIASRNPDRMEPKAPIICQANCNDLSISAEDIVDRIDFELSRFEFYGDAFPMFNMDCFGPGVVAAFLGARLDNSTGNVWFHAPEDKHISELHFEYNPENLWLKRIKDIYKCAMDRWEGSALMGMVDLGGVMDILSTFRHGDGLLLDLYDEPEEVKRVATEISILWHTFYKDLNSVLQPTNPGYTDWSKIYSDKPLYILQSDFSYMIGPEMFEEFILDEVKQTCKMLDRTVWHLDGVGELPHLDHLLAIDELDGIQWVPGAGNGACVDWPQIYKKISEKGKLTQLIGCDFEGVEKIIADLGTSKGLQHCTMAFTHDYQDYALEWLNKFKVL